MLNNINSNKLPLGLVSEKTKTSTKEILYWEKKCLIKSERSSLYGRLFDVQQILNLKKRLKSKRSQYRFHVHVSKSTKYSVIELFSGAGGLALGLSNAGFKSRLLVEFDKDAVATLKKNRPKWPVIHDDIKNVDFKPYYNEVDVVAGGFPCQAFSYAGAGRGFTDTRGTLFFEFARCVEEIRPKIALGENVKGLIQHDNGRTLKAMIERLSELGYDVTWKLLQAQYLDVAQKRERLIILGIRKDLKMPFIFPKGRDHCLILRDVLKSCPKSEGATYPKRKAYIMSKVPEGGYWRDLPIELQKEYMQGSFYLGGGKTGMARRLAWDEPSLTLVCTPAQGQTERCHPTETRPLTIRESARIQSFPDQWKFEGSMGSQYKQIGNAVPVNLAYYVGRCLIAMLSGKFDSKTMVIQEPAEAQLELSLSV